MHLAPCGFRTILNHFGNFPSERRSCCIVSRSNKPRKGNDKPQKGNDKPQKGDGKPKEGDGKPKKGDGKPQKGDDKPQKGDGKPKKGDGKRKKGDAVVLHLAPTDELQMLVDSIRSPYIIPLNPRAGDNGDTVRVELHLMAAALEQNLDSKGFMESRGGQSKSIYWVSPRNLLENTNGETPTPPPVGTPPEVGRSEHPINIPSSRQAAAFNFADARYIDDVIAF